MIDSLFSFSPLPPRHEITEHQKRRSELSGVGQQALIALLRERRQRRWQYWMSIFRGKKVPQQKQPYCQI